MAAMHLRVLAPFLQRHLQSVARPERGDGLHLDGMPRLETEAEPLGQATTVIGPLGIRAPLLGFGAHTV